MTLILSAANARGVAQATDLRVMKGEGIGSDSANKTVLVQCADASLSLSFCGLARVGYPPDDTETDRWLFSELQGMRATGLSFPKLLDALEHRTVEILRRTPGGNTEPLTIVGVGLRESNSMPFVFWVSNHLDARGDETGNTTSVSAHVFFPQDDADPSTRLVLLAVGQEASVTLQAKSRLGAMRSAGVLQGLDPHQLVDELRRVLQEAHASDVSGSVGVDQRGYGFWPDGSIDVIGGTGVPLLIGRR